MFEREIICLPPNITGSRIILTFSDWVFQKDFEKDKITVQYIA